jgi:hypothetical protein
VDRVHFGDPQANMAETSDEGGQQRQKATTIEPSDEQRVQCKGKTSFVWLFAWVVLPVVQKNERRFVWLSAGSMVCLFVLLSGCDGGWWARNR